MPVLHCEFFFVTEEDTDSEKKSLRFLQSIGMVKSMTALNGFTISIEVAQYPQLIETMIMLDDMMETDFFPVDGRSFTCSCLTKLGATLFAPSQTFNCSSIFIPMRNIISIDTRGPEYLKGGLKSWMENRLQAFSPEHSTIPQNV